MKFEHFRTRGREGVKGIRTSEFPNQNFEESSLLNRKLVMGIVWGLSLCQVGVPNSRANILPGSSGLDEQHNQQQWSGGVHLQTDGQDMVDLCSCHNSYSSFPPPHPPPRPFALSSCCPQQRLGAFLPVPSPLSHQRRFHGVLVAHDYISVRHLEYH